MVRILAAMIILFLGTNMCFADVSSLISEGIDFYKKGDYEQCIATMKGVIRNDPAASLGYYYLALAYSKTGKNTLAVRNYDKVITLGADKTLVDLSHRGKACLGGKNITAVEVQIEDITDEPDDAPIRMEEKKFSSDELRTKHENKIQNPQITADGTKSVSSPENTQPTNDEIVNAIRVLQKAGLLNNNFQGYYDPQMNAKTRQMNSLLMMMGQNNNNSSNNDVMNMLPYMNRGNNQINPQMLQMMMMNQMMPNFSSGY